MLTRTKFCFFLFVLQCAPSLLIPLAQRDVESTSNTNNLLVLETNEIEQITPKNSIVTELLQQIDVKDDENHVISNINQMVVSDENIQNDNNVTQNNVLVQSRNVKESSVLNHTEISHPFNDSSTLLMTKSLNASSENANNTKMHGLENNLADEAKTNDNANVNNATIKEVTTVQNGSTSKVKMSSSLAPNTNIASRRTSINISSKNDASLNNIFLPGLDNEETGVPTLATIDGENILHESLIDGDAEIAWRSDIPVKKNKTIAKSDSQNATLLTNNNNSDLLNSENGDEKSIFVILNSGSIDGLSVNSPVNSGNLQTNLENKTIENLNSSYSKLLKDLINSTINDVLSKILQQNISNSNSKHIFLLLNSGSISNVQVSSPILENIVKNPNLKDRSRRHLNYSNTNNTDIESLTLKPSTDKSNLINGIKFRTGEHQGTQNYVNKNNHAAITPLDNNQNNSTLVSNAPDNATLAYSNATVLDIPIEEISSAEAPAFRSLIPDKIRKLHQVSNVVTNELKETKDHNLVLKLSPESLPISIDLNQIPINNILGDALSFIKRLKRNTHDRPENSYPWKSKCKSKQIDEHHTSKSSKKPQSFNNNLTTQTRKSIDDNISNVLNFYDTVQLVCPLSAIVKLYTHQVLDNIATRKNDSDSVLNKILSSFVKGNEDAINLASIELSHLPIRVMLRLQLVHEKTKEFMEQLSDIIDVTLCSLS